MARHTKLTPEVTKRLLEAFSVGATHRIACEYAGIDTQTMYNWIEKGQAGRVPYVGFVEQLKASQGQAAVGWLAKIEKAANEGTWQAAAWKLERRYPHEYGRTVLEQTGEISINHVVRLPVKAQTEAEWLASHSAPATEEGPAHDGRD